MKGNPSLYLEGQELDGGWIVGKQIAVGKSTTAGTGGNFTVAYHVADKDGRPAFLKALDYGNALEEPNPSVVLQELTAAYNFECDILRKCGERRLDRIVRVLATGSKFINLPDVSGPAEYLIFELADSDIRKFLSFSQEFDLALRLRALHHVATGLKQIHGCGIAHQDLKPSNVLVFENKIFKLADFGRSAHQGYFSPFDNWQVPGDRTYAPPELLYGYQNPEWNMKRLSCDIYHLGSMAVYFFTGVGMTPLLFKHLPADFKPPYLRGLWRGTFQEVLPYLIPSFQTALQEFASQIPNSELRAKLIEPVSQLCDPDPARRGHPKNRNKDGNTFSLERYLSVFDNLAKRAEAGYFRLEIK